MSRLQPDRGLRKKRTRYLRVQVGVRVRQKHGSRATTPYAYTQIETDPAPPRPFTLLAGRTVNCYPSRMKLIVKHCALTVGVWGVLASLAGAASYDQVDDFEDGTTMGWSGNRFGTVTHVSGNGPGGGSDDYIETSIASFHLGTKNTDQWTGDFLAAGIAAIEADLNHLDPIAQRLNMRIVLFGPGGVFASQGITANVPTNTWTHYVFGLSSNDLVYVADGSGNLHETLTSVTNLLLRHDSPSPTPPGFHPPHVSATLGIDNVHAVPRQPILGDLTVTSTQLSIDLTQLVVGVTNRVQIRSDLNAGAWSNAIIFAPTSETSNVTVNVSGDQGYIRSVTQ